MAPMSEVQEIEATRVFKVLEKNANDFLEMNQGRTYPLDESLVASQFNIDRYKIDSEYMRIEITYRKLGGKCR